MKSSRVLPSFVGLGAPKAATTWLFHCLREHPDIFIPDEKEIGFFSYLDDIDDRLDEYSSYFKGAENLMASGEIFVTYLSSEVAAERIKRFIPDVKLFVSLRNPVEQVYSYYWHLKRQNFHSWGDDSFIAPSNFIEALDRIPDQLITPALYAEHLKRWFSLFPRDQIKVMFYEDIKSEPLEQLHALYRFLDVDDTFIPPSLKRRDAKVRSGMSPKSAMHDHAHAKVYSFLNRYVYHQVKKLIGVSAATRIKDGFRVREVIQKIFYRQGYPEISRAEKDKVLALVGDDIKELERLVSRDLSHWFA